MRVIALIVRDQDEASQVRVWHNSTVGASAGIAEILSALHERLLTSTRP